MIETTIIIPQCFRCTNLREEPALTCDVYPEGIENKFLFNEMECKDFKKEQGYDTEKREMEFRQQGKSKD